MYFLIKRRHYSGGDSVISRRDTKEEAQELADAFNYDYHSDNYYVEEYDPQKVTGWTT